MTLCSNPYYIFFNVTTEAELEQAIKQAYDALELDSFVLAA